MNALIILLPLSLFLGGLFLILFIFAVKNGQFKDLKTPAMRMLIGESEKKDQNDIINHKSKELETDNIAKESQGRKEEDDECKLKSRNGGIRL